MKPAARKSRAKKGGEKQGSKVAAKGGTKAPWRREVKATSLRDADFFNFPHSQLLVLIKTKVVALHYLKWGLMIFVLPFLQQKIIVKSACGGQRV
jgi:hypothetical protein